MNPTALLSTYLDRVGRRLRFFAWVRGAAVVASTALLLTLLFAVVLGWVAFSPAALVWCRATLFLGVELSLAFALLIPLLRLTPHFVVRTAEHRHRRFEQRLLTFFERSRTHPADPFLPFLAADTLDLAADARPVTFVSTRALLGPIAIAAASCCMLAWLIAAGPGNIGYRVQALWAVRTVFRVELEPAPRTVGRGSGLPIAARLKGFIAARADLWVHTAASKWQRLTTSAEPGGVQFEWKLSALAADAEFYAVVEGIRSPLFRVRTVDAPHVRNITVSYAGVPSDSDGDLVAPAGAVANLTIETDRPMSGAALVFGQGLPLPLPATQNNRTSATVTIDADDSYHVGVQYAGDSVPVSDEHQIVALRHREYSKGRPTASPDGIRSQHSGPVPAEYQKAVDEYFRRLNDLKRGH